MNHTCKLHKLLAAIENVKLDSFDGNHICSSCACGRVSVGGGNRRLVLQIFVELRLLAISLAVDLPLSRFFYSLGSILAILFVYVRIDKLSVAIIPGYPACGSRCTLTARSTGRVVRRVEIQGSMMVSGRWPSDSVSSGRIRRM